MIAQVITLKSGALPADLDYVEESTVSATLGAASIRAVHREQYETAEELSGQAAAHLSEAMAAVKDHPDIRHAGFVHDASKEYAEARMTLAFVRGDPLPTAEELVGVDVQAYLNGMAEAASELRRYILDLLRRGRPERGEELAELPDLAGVRRGEDQRLHRAANAAR